MPVSPAPDSTLFVTIPVEDPERSKAFFTKLGFSYNPAMSGETTACMAVSEHAFFMMGDHATFAQNSHLPMADSKTHALALYSFTVAERDDVDAVVEAALEAGGRPADDAEDFGFMRSRSFFDLDGHGWNVIWMNPDAAGQGADEAAQQGAGAAS